MKVKEAKKEKKEKKKKLPSRKKVVKI